MYEEYDRLAIRSKVVNVHLNTFTHSWHIVLYLCDWVGEKYKWVEGVFIYGTVQIRGKVNVSHRPHAACHQRNRECGLSLPQATRSDTPRVDIQHPRVLVQPTVLIAF